MLSVRMLHGGAPDSDREGRRSRAMPRSLVERGPGNLVLVAGASLHGGAGKVLYRFAATGSEGTALATAHGAVIHLDGAPAEVGGEDGGNGEEPDEGHEAEGQKQGSEDHLPGDSHSHELHRRRGNDPRKDYGGEVDADVVAIALDHSALL